MTQQNLQDVLRATVLGSKYIVLGGCIRKGEKI